MDVIGYPYYSLRWPTFLRKVWRESLIKIIISKSSYSFFLIKKICYLFKYPAFNVLIFRSTRIRLPGTAADNPIVVLIKFRQGNADCSFYAARTKLKWTKKYFYARYPWYCANSLWLHIVVRIHSLCVGIYTTFPLKKNQTPRQYCL